MSAFEKTYKASELVAKLQKLIAEHGDFSVVADDADTGWRLPIGVVFKAPEPKEEWPARFEIKTKYHGDPKGGPRWMTDQT